MNTAISYIVPAYNCCATLAQSISSIVDGNLSGDDEIVVVDDGSTDGTTELLVDLAAANSAMRIVTHAHNRGGGAARNTAVMHARHNLIFCLDSDNLLVPGSVVRLRDILFTEGADAAAFHELHYFTERSDSPTHKWRFPPGVFTLADHLAGFVVPGASGNYLYTRRSWIRAGGYPEYAGALDTWGFGLRQLATGQRVMVLPDGFYYHRHGHESYWVRAAKDADRISLVALQNLIPFIDKIAPADADYVMSRKGRFRWFHELDRRPLRLATGKYGKAGVALSVAGEELAAAARSRSVVKRQLKLARTTLRRLFAGRREAES